MITFDTETAINEKWPEFPPDATINKSILPSLNNPEVDSRRPNGKKALIYGFSLRKLLFVFFGLAALAILTPSAQAGIFSFFANIPLASAGTATPPLAQTMSLLETGNSAASQTIETQIVDDNSLLSDSGPLGSAADFASATPATSDQISVYTVRKGDSFSIIADLYNVSINTILWANDLKKGSAIHEGDKLVILPISGIQYVVKKGDTLASVAKRYSGDKEEILAFNNLDSELLTAGQEIIIPDGETAPAGSTGGSRPGLPSYASYYLRPVDGGRRSQGIHGHNGIDIAAPNGTPVYAAAAGTVLIAKDGGWNGAYGSYVVIKHGNGTQTLYAHLSAVNISAGQSVTRGQTIGRVGSTGRSTGNHLHFEVRGAKNPF
ncbi:MAG: peptidoglycan DD-metalloendopeptidase family protein [Candidatus Vogelbacteria bacterium]|nr:peptidoglycan DD-metalloendopeptidase family protein [Candidatus Vogelbacteria bacterium]